MNRVRAVLMALLTATAISSCDDDGAHSHDGFEIPAGEAVPTVELVATEDPVSGWNLEVRTTNFTFAPQRAGREFVLGEGHGHLYVDGEKIDRLYGAWYHLDNLAAGEHTIEVTLNGNNHAAYQAGGRSIADAVTVQVEEQPHNHVSDVALESNPDMEVTLRVEEDPLGGWNVFVETAGFTWAPDGAGSDPVGDHGHAHLYLDDRKVGRIYGPAVYLGPLVPGAHTISVSLHGNNHAPYMRDGVAVAASVTVEQTEGVEGEVRTVAIEVRNGVVVGGAREVEVVVGDAIELTIISDRADTIHVHGYEVVADLPAGAETGVEFVSNIPGVFEIELEDSGIPLMWLTVR